MQTKRATRNFRILIADVNAELEIILQKVLLVQGNCDRP